MIRNWGVASFLSCIYNCIMSKKGFQVPIKKINKIKTRKVSRLSFSMWWFQSGPPRSFPGSVKVRELLHARSGLRKDSHLWGRRIRVHLIGVFYAKTGKELKGSYFAPVWSGATLSSSTLFFLFLCFSSIIMANIKGSSQSR